MVLGVFLGPGNPEESNWRPRIDAVEHVLNSWHQCCLSFKARTLVVNALALARIWYVTSLIHVPEWVLFEVNKLISKFFWNGKRDLVARQVVVQPTCNRGFGKLDVLSKISDLHVQWIRRFVNSSFSWSLLLTYLFSVQYNATPVAVFSNPFSFSPHCLPPFYAAFLCAWRSCGGYFTSSSLGIGAGIAFQSVSPFTPCSVYRLGFYSSLLLEVPSTFWRPLLGRDAEAAFLFRH